MSLFCCNLVTFHTTAGDLLSFQVSGVAYFQQVAIKLVQK